MSFHILRINLPSLILRNKHIQKVHIKDLCKNDMVIDKMRIIQRQYKMITFNMTSAYNSYTVGVKINGFQEKL